MAKEDDGIKRQKVTQMSDTPPGFDSHTSFMLKRSDSNNETCSSMDFGSDFELEFGRGDGPFNVVNSVKLDKSLRRRPWILHNQLNDCEESVTDHIDINPPLKKSLPKGVIRGCSNCDDCQKITATWRPKESCVPEIESAPVFYPSEEEFKDTLKYVASICQHAEEYGMCRIVPPQSWQPPCLIKEKKSWETSKFHTRVQRLDELQYLHSKRKLYEINEKIKGKARRISATGLESGAADRCTTDHDKARICTDAFDFEHGPEFTLKSFKDYANDFKLQYFCKKEKGTGSGTLLQEMWNPSENIEGEYWRILENPTEEIEVLSGADVDATVFGSGFPVRSNSAVKLNNSEYVEAGWNLNNVSQLPGSLLAFETSKASSVLVPRLQIGMCFSSYCWKAEEHHLYSLSYLHLGAPKICYGIPSRYSVKFEAALKKKFPELSLCPELSHKLVTQLSPSSLKAEGIPVYRCVHYPRQFILVLPGAYHSGFDRGFNCSEAVNFAPLDWLPYGQNTIELYTELCRKTSLSHDKLLTGAAMQAVRALWEVVILKQNSVNKFQWASVCGKDGILTRAMKSRVKTESTRREYLCASSQSRKMEKDFDSSVKRECAICFYDLHLSCACCSCSPDKYSCLNHSKQLCSCPWSFRFFLFRYTISELNLLIEALEENPDAIKKWASENLGLTMRSHSFKDASQKSRHVSSGETCFLNSEKEALNSFLQSNDTTLYPCSKVAGEPGLDKILASEPNIVNNHENSRQVSSDETCFLNSEKEALNSFFQSNDTTLYPCSKVAGEPGLDKIPASEQNIVNNHGPSYGKASSRNLSSEKETRGKSSSACKSDVIINLTDDEDD